MPREAWTDERLDDRFARMEARFDRLEARLDRMEDRWDARFERLRAQLDKRFFVVNLQVLRERERIPFCHGLRGAPDEDGRPDVALIQDGADGPNVRPLRGKYLKTPGVSAHTKSRLVLESLRTLRSEDTGQGRSLPGSG